MNNDNPTVDRDYDDKDLSLFKKEKSKKEKGYIKFESDDSADELVFQDGRKLNTVKVKKTKPSFRFPTKRERIPKLKDSQRIDSSKDERKSDDHHHKKKKEKNEKDDGSKKSKKKRHEKSRSMLSLTEQRVTRKPIFGVPLELAIERSKSHDGIQLPAVFRQCLDFIEEYGLRCEGIYRVDGVKSRTQQLYNLLNSGNSVDLSEYEPHIVASILKRFLRELPDQILTQQLHRKFEQAAVLTNHIQRGDRQREKFRQLLSELPGSNRLLLSWMIVHMYHVVTYERINRMTTQNVCLVLSPSLGIKLQVLFVFFAHIHDLFGDVVIKKYIPPLRPVSSRWSLTLPDTIEDIKEEIAKQESLLKDLLVEVNNAADDTDKSEQLWEAQRVQTQLKRKLKKILKDQQLAKEEAVKQEQKSEQTCPGVELNGGSAVKFSSEEGKEDKPSPDIQPLVSDSKTDELRTELKGLIQVLKQKTQDNSHQSTLKSSKTPINVENNHKIDNELSLHPNSDANHSKNKSHSKESIDNEIQNFTETTTKAELIRQSSLPVDSTNTNVIQSQDKNNEFPHENHHAAVTTEDNFVMQSDQPQNIIEYTRLKFANDELKIIGDELRHRIAAERREIKRLRKQVNRALTKRSDSQDSNFNASPGQTELKTKIAAAVENEDPLILENQYKKMLHENKILRRQNEEFIKKIQEERNLCVKYKVAIRMHQETGVLPHARKQGFNL